MDCLARGGHQALYVGGCVRDALIGREASDIDISTDALPREVMRLADAEGFRCVPTGIDHGTVTVIAEGRAHEVTTFRRDVETDGRRAVVAFSRDIAEDAMRRDFTMNALYADAEGRVVDPLGGLPDLDARHVRFIGEAHERIAEDHLRILRFFRFHAWYADAARGLDAEGLAACAQGAAGLDTLPGERIGAEMLKLLAAPGPCRALGAMEQSGILARVLPGAAARDLFPLVHLEGSLNLEPEPLRRLAAIGGAEPEVRLRLSRQQAKRLSQLRDGIGAVAGTAELAYRLGPETARDIELLRAAGFGAALPAALDEDIALGTQARFPLRAADLMPELKGPALGARLAELEADWIASGFALDRAALLARR
nr:CCA tRNA nucleotidyltransferase [Profundibacterium mesophilum]